MSAEILVPGGVWLHSCISAVRTLLLQVKHSLYISLLVYCRLHWGQISFSFRPLASGSSCEADWVCSCHTEETPHQTHVFTHKSVNTWVWWKRTKKKITSALFYLQQQTQIPSCCDKRKRKATMSLDWVSEYLSIKWRPRADGWDGGTSTS